MKIIRIFLCTFFLLVATQEGRGSYFAERSIKRSEAFLVSKPGEVRIVSEIYR